jgi:uncharacterized membrane protein YjfL (UPF0719 family)
LANLEIFAFIASIFLALKGWTSWYGQILRVTRLASPMRWRVPLLIAPLFCAALLIVALRTLAARDVRGDVLYLAFYLLLGAGWVGGMTLLFPFLGVSARDDVLERGNRSASWAVGGALIGATCSFAGANIGNGPGIEAVLFSAVLSSGLFVLLWIGLDALTSLSEAITVDRDTGAGIRLGGFLIGLGIVSGWAVAGDWVSATATLKDFLWSSWPAIVLSGIAVLIELVWRQKSRRPSKASLSATIALAYIILASVWVVAHGGHS